MHNNTHSIIPRPLFILIRGLPGSGKSYLAEAIASAIGKDHVLLLDPDMVDTASREYQALVHALTKEGVEEKFFPYRYLRTKAFAAIESHKVVIWNQAFTLLGGFHRTIDSLREHAAKHRLPLPVLVVEVTVSPAIAKQRIARRAQQGGHDVSDENFARFLNDYVSFADQGYPTISVDGDADTDGSVQAILTAVQSLKNK